MQHKCQTPTAPGVAGVDLRVNHQHRASNRTGIAWNGPKKLQFDSHTDLRDARRSNKAGEQKHVTICHMPPGRTPSSRHTLGTLSTCQSGLNHAFFRMRGELECLCRAAGFCAPRFSTNAVNQ
ncbi:hypothetical protein EYF80_013384 [Liparis tanakae]|uniref:Uncharacterized protein n=1 Tax=Liparis tanakae TaxID=230148 RepID=A0A4Z2IFD9_9TELE|nr:hypothetical protein EYF80_013384 [Liparis tanakae]